MLLILGMASVANASLQISVHPGPGMNPDPTWDPLNPEPSTITIGKGDTLLLDIYTDSLIYGTAPEEGDWLLYTDTNLATISGGKAADVFPGNTIAIYNGKATGGWAPEPQDPMDGVGGAIFIFGAPIVGSPTAPVTIYDEIEFQCTGIEGDALLSLVSGTVVGNQIEITGVWDEVVIHQTPEPMTLGLFGLGGLGLLRRRRS